MAKIPNRINELKALIKIEQNAKTKTILQLEYD